MICSLGYLRKSSFTTQNKFHQHNFCISASWSWSRCLNDATQLQRRLAAAVNKPWQKYFTHLHTCITTARKIVILYSFCDTHDNFTFVYVQKDFDDTMIIFCFILIFILIFVILWCLCLILWILNICYCHQVNKTFFNFPRTSGAPKRAFGANTFPHP